MTGTGRRAALHGLGIGKVTRCCVLVGVGSVAYLFDTWYRRYRSLDFVFAQQQQGSQKGNRADA
jgi:hypothetical protein